MIYLDLDGYCDSENEPVNRNEICVNCGKEWYDHSGWSCNGYGPADFSSLEITKRYLTQKMINSLLVPMDAVKELNKNTSNKSINSEVDVSDWRSWAHNIPGECACGIKRHMCTYHK